MINGTDVISRCRKNFGNQTSVPDDWKDAFVACRTESVGNVKSTNKVTVKLKPNESITLSGMVKNCRQVVSAMTENTNGASSRIGACLRVVRLDKDGKNQRVPVKIYRSTKEIEITPKTALCELQGVKVLRHLGFGTVKGKKVQSCPQTVHETTLPEEDQLPSGIDLTDSTLRTETINETVSHQIERNIFEGDYRSWKL